MLLPQCEEQVRLPVKEASIQLPGSRPGLSAGRESAHPANYTYFIKAVLPVAEKANVRLALHPDDPPMPMMNGVAKIFTHYDGIRRADEIAGRSKYWGLTFCVGT